MPPGSLARRLVARVFPAVLVLVITDISITYLMTRSLSLEAWLSKDVFWTMVLSQVTLVSVFAWLLLSGVRSGLASINRLSQEVRQRDAEDLQPLDPTGLPAEIAPLIVHFNELLHRLDDSLQGQKRFVGQAAHQLRTPLTGLKLELELMLTQELPDDVRARTERIKAATDRMIRLGQQLLVLARADASVRPQDSFARTDLGEWARLSGSEWLPATRKQGITLHMNAPSQPVWVDADTLLLDELLSNLIDNALRYAKDAQNLWLTVAANPPSLSVQDDGAGIPAEDRARVFEAFYRSSTAGQEGSGLGLAIVREIARAHGAWWNLVSRPQFPGTRITIVFPGPRIGARLSRHESGEASYAYENGPGQTGPLAKHHRNN